MSKGKRKPISVYNLGIPLLICCLLLASAIFIQHRIANAFQTETETVTTETDFKTETETETEVEWTSEEMEIVENEITTPRPVPTLIGVYEYKGYLHINCAVTDISDDYETFTVFLPTGEYEEFYMIQDPPVDDECNPYFERITFIVPKESYEDLNQWKVFAVQ